ncbi:MAG: DUF3341 domain-containing protein [Vicinamibacterales bacterium]|jgi:hypothetical protein
MGTLLGIYDDRRNAIEAISSLQKDGVDNISAYTPAPDHTIEGMLNTRISPVRLFVLIGGILGCIAGFAFPIYTVYAWPLITGGKPLISIPAFVVIAFELMILFGAIAGMVSFFGLSGLPQTRLALRDTRFTNDHFGIEVQCADAKQSTIRAAMETAGAIEVQTHA